jgi:hypothetical protein
MILVIGQVSGEAMPEEVVVPLSCNYPLMPSRAVSPNKYIQILPLYTVKIGCVNL